MEPHAPPWLLADNVLILVLFPLDPGRRSGAAFTKRCSLLAGPLANRLCQGDCENKQNRRASRQWICIMHQLLQFCADAKRRITCRTHLKKQD
jgi:hypothetical protein